MERYDDLKKWYKQYGPRGDIYFFGPYRNGWVTPKGDKFRLVHCGREIATIDSDDVVTITKGDLHNLDLLRLSQFTDTSFYPDATTHRNKKQTKRWTKAYRNDDSVPITKGMQIQYRKLINPEVCVDEVLRTNRKKARQVREQYIRPFIKTATAMIKLGAVVALPDQQRWLDGVEKKRLALRIAKEEPTVELVTEAIISLSSGWYYYTAKPDEAMRIQRFLGVMPTLECQLEQILFEHYKVRKYVSLTKEKN